MPLRLEDALRLQPERDIVPHRSPRIERRVLEHHDPRRPWPRDRDAVLAQRAGARPLEARHQPQQRGLAAARGAEQRHELAGANMGTDVLQHRQDAAVDVEVMADAMDVQRRAGRRGGRTLGKGQRYHLTTPFCQISKRSRALNSSVIAPEQSSDITIRAAYMLA
jgi:hypothetical protein